MRINMIGKLILYFSFLVHFCSIFAQNDSIFIETGQNKEVFFVQNVNPKQTLFSLSREFRCGVETIAKLNPEHSNGLVKDKLIKIAIQNQIINQIDPCPKKRKPIYYRINEQETAFSVLVNRLNLSWEQIKRLNPQIISGTQKTDALIKVGWLNKDEDLSTSVSQTDSLAQIKADQISPEIVSQFNASNFSFTKSSRGLGIWEKSYQSGNSYYALHRTARINSMIEITNPVKSRTVYAKVIGRIPRTYPNNCEVVITGNVARDLCLANKRFFSQLRYSR